MVSQVVLVPNDEELQQIALFANSITTTFPNLYRITGLWYKECIYDSRRRLAIPAYGIGRAAASSVRYVKDWGYRLRHIELGGDYKDTETAYNLRMRTVSEMSSAQSYSRRWLGNEALYMR